MRYLLEQVDGMLVEAVVPWDNESGVDPTTMKAAMIAETVLFPHEHNLEGIKPTAWTANTNTSCDCIFEEFIDLNTSVGETEGDLNMTLDEEVEAVSEDQVLTRAQ